MKNIIYILTFILLFGSMLDAQNCDFFEDGGTAGWTGINARVVHNTVDGNGVLDVSDRQDESWVVNTTFNSGTVGSTICYNYNLIEDSMNGATALTTQIYLITNAASPQTGTFARFILNTPIDEDSGWQSISVPINTIGNGDPLPNNALGTWVMGNPAQWNNLVNTFTGVAFFVDVVGSSTQNENFLIDNFCTEGDLDIEFTIEPGCLSGDYFIDLLATDILGLNYTWSIYETTVPNATTGGTLIGTIQNAGPGVSIGDLDVMNYYYVELFIAGNECLADDLLVQVVPFYIVESNFVLQDAEGNITNTFCYSEDIIMDGNASIGENNHKVYIKRRPFPNPNNQGWSQYDDYGWINGEAGIINITDVFADQDYYFPAGFEYAITLAVQNTGECVNWVVTEQLFTVECCEDVVPDLNADFLFITECQDNFKYYIAAIVEDEDQPNVNFEWSIFQTDMPDQTTGGTEIYTSTGFDLEFDGLEIENFYYLQLTVTDKVCGHSVTFVQVIPYYEIGSVFHFEDENGVLTDDFCYGQDVIFNGLASFGEDDYYIGLERRPFPNNGEDYSYVGTLGWSGQPAEIFNLTEAFVEIGIFFEPGYEYRVGLAVQNTAECVNWVLEHESFVVQCCDDVFSASFQLAKDPIAGTNLSILEAVNLAEFNNIEVEHQWTLISTPDINEGPYTEVSVIGGDTFSAEVEDGLCYIVIHKLITACGEFCYAQNECINLEKNEANLAANASFNSFVDCSILDSLFCDPPVKLFVDCGQFPNSEFILNWLEVASANNYTIQITFNDPECCRSKFKAFQLEFEVEDNFLDLGTVPLPFFWDCLSWRVKSDCGNEESGWSKKKCFTSCRPIIPRQSGESFEAQLYPNPTYDNVQLSFGKNFAGSVQLVNLKGDIVSSQSYQNVQSVDVSLIDQSPGIYIVLVKDQSGTHPFRVVKY